MSMVLSKHRKSVLNVYGDLHFYGMTSNVAVQNTVCRDSSECAAEDVFEI